LANIIVIVHYLNSREIYHRDLKPGNFLVKTELHWRVILHLNDFGLAKNLRRDYSRLTTRTGVFNGTMEYLAPEIVNATLAKPNI
jgi:serine/threonine protein kinase